MITQPDKNTSVIIFEMSEQKMYRFHRMKNLPSCDCIITALQRTKEALCVGKTTNVIWECSELCVFKLRQSCFHRNCSLIRQKGGYEFSAESTWHTDPWAHWDSTGWASAPSWKEHQLQEDRVSPHPELGHKHPPCHKAAMSLAVKSLGERGDTLGSGVELFRLPRAISHKPYPFISIYSHLFGSNKL